LHLHSIRNDPLTHSSKRTHTHTHTRKQKHTPHFVGDPAEPECYRWGPYSVGRHIRHVAGPLDKPTRAHRRNTPHAHNNGNNAGEGLLKNLFKHPGSDTHNTQHTQEHTKTIRTSHVFVAAVFRWSHVGMAPYLLTWECDRKLREVAYLILSYTTILNKPWAFRGPLEERPVLDFVEHVAALTAPAPRRGIRQGHDVLQILTRIVPPGGPRKAPRSFIKQGRLLSNLAYSETEFGTNAQRGCKTRHVLKRAF